MLIGVILLMAATTAAYFVFYVIPRFKNPHRHQHPGNPTNSSVVSLSGSEPLKLEAFEKYEVIILGGLLCAFGLLVILLEH